MALIYRAIWEESRDDLDEVGRVALAEWLKGKGIDAGPLDDGELSGSLPYNDLGTEHLGAFDLDLRRVSADGLRVLRGRLREQRPQVGQTWTTTLTVLAAGGGGGEIWIDIERLSDDPFERVSFRSPRLVRSTISPHLDRAG